MRTLPLDAVVAGNYGSYKLNKNGHLSGEDSLVLIILQYLTKSLGLKPCYVSELNRKLRIWLCPFLLGHLYFIDTNNPHEETTRLFHTIQNKKVKMVVCFVILSCTDG